MGLGGLTTSDSLGECGYSPVFFLLPYSYVRTWISLRYHYPPVPLVFATRRHCFPGGTRVLEQKPTHTAVLYIPPPLTRNKDLLHPGLFIRDLWGIARVVRSCLLIVIGGIPIRGMRPADSASQHHLPAADVN